MLSAQWQCHDDAMKVRKYLGQKYLPNEDLQRLLELTIGHAIALMTSPMVFNLYGWLGQMVCVETTDKIILNRVLDGRRSD